MRRSLLSWVLSLSLLLAQQGALLHELGHLSHHHDSTAGTAALSAQLQGAEDGLCPTCQAFAQIANPATAGTAGLALSPPALIPARPPSYVIVGADAPSPRSRGPPQV
jgi:hypothetical protein